MKEYLTNKTVYGIKPTNENLEMEFENHCKVKLAKERTLPSNEKDLKNTIHAYAIFFPVIDGPTPMFTKPKLHQLKGLESYDLLPSIKIKEKENLGTVLGHMMNYQLLTTELTNTILPNLIEIISKELDLQGPEIHDEIFALLHYFSYPPNKDSFLALHNDVIYDPKLGCHNVTPGVDPCSDGTKIERCSDYCERASLGRRKAIVQEILEMSTDSIMTSSESSESPPTTRPTLGSCTWEDEKPCWSKIINDRGLCFTNFKKGIAMH